MGSRSRSIRLRIYFLVAIPLVAMVGLLAYVAGTSVSNAIDLDRAPDLINKTSLPAANFVNYLQAERAAAVTYLSAPGPATLAAYDTAVANTSRNSKVFQAALTSPATVRSETPSEAAAINAMLGSLGKLTLIEGEVRARAVQPLAALSAYSQGIAAEPALFLTEADSETDAAAVSQALGLIATVQAREELSQEWALLGGMLAGDRMTKDESIAFTEAAATRQAELGSAQSILTPANLAVYHAAQAGSAAAQRNLAAIEQDLAGGAPVSLLPTTQAQWQQTAGTLLKDYFNGGVAVSQAELVTDHQSSRSAWIRVAVTSGIALLALLLTIVVTTLVARGIIRRLRGLERSALTVAQQQLPDVIGRLRRGEDVDVEHEAAPLQAGPVRPGPAKINGDEIDRVGQSFDLVRQTAIRAAVEEARLRRGLNDVFRSLARRSQSLLHRQLTLLDQMERRATDPESRSRPGARPGSPARPSPTSSTCWPSSSRTPPRSRRLTPRSGCPGTSSPADSRSKSRIAGSGWARSGWRNSTNGWPPRLSSTRPTASSSACSSSASSPSGTASGSRSRRHPTAARQPSC